MLLVAVVCAPVARAQSNAAFTCAAGVDSPATVRAEGTAELVSDLLLRCTGGTPAATVQLTLNTTIAGDAQLVIEGPVPTVHKAHPGAAANTVTWVDVPFDAPGTTELVIRLTNVHANASVIPTSIVAFVQITGSQPITVVNPQQTLAHVKQGLFAGAKDATLRQCVNRAALDPPVSDIVIKEGFAQSFGGARIRIRFNNAGAGVGIVLPAIVLLTTERTGNWAGGYLQLLDAPEPANESTAVYEAVNPNPSVVEVASIPVRVGFTGLPAPAQVTANVSFDPRSQFCDRSKALNVFHIDACTCTLLFPVVTQKPGFDTAIIIVNTTPDPFGATPQAGPVTLWFYGSAPEVQTTMQVVSSGGVMIWTARAGGATNARGLQPAPGFTGFVIAQSSFQNCAGFAYIWDLDKQQRVDRYTAIELTDKPSSQRRSRFKVTD